MRIVKGAPAPGRTSRGEPAGGFTAGGDEVRFVSLLALLGVLSLTLLVLAEIATAPLAVLPGVVTFSLATGATLVTISVLLRHGTGDRVLAAAGIALMLMGVAAGALLPNGLDAAAMLPLAGAVLTLPAYHGRPLVVSFLVGFLASMIGEALAYTVGASHGGGLGLFESLAGSGAMLALVYTLIWWIGARWWWATARAQQSAAGHRRLLEVNERLLSARDPEGVFGLIADSLKSLMAYDNLSIYRVDRAAGVMRPVLARDRFADLIMDATFPMDRGITGWVVEHAEAQCVNDTGDDPRAANIPGTPDEPESLIVVPLLVRGEVAGTLNMGRMGLDQAHFTESEFELARLFAAQASIALQNAETHREVLTRAETDSLTELHNRGSFDDRIETLTGRTVVQPLALIMVDLDDFKVFNDRHGHPAGDVVLRDIGRAIGSAVRDRDLAFRYGGDEFAVIIPRMAVPAAAQVAERIIRAISTTPTATGERITASAGVAGDPCHTSDSQSLVAAADSALYRAKAAGGDRVATCSQTLLDDPDASEVVPVGSHSK